ncbi:hypothetical protein DMA11_18730 [Marinilabiliaceae bacterium JC017]|nr:hypothetical protein DMA11_18730 [Marinilabiliaceae bacterium JC017]
MKKLWIMAFVAILGLNVSVASAQRQQQKSTEEMVEQNMKTLKEKITMESDAATSIEQTLTTFYDDLKSMKSSGQRPDRSKMDDIVKERNDKVKKVLSGDEYQAFLAVIEASKPQGRRR